MTLTTILSRVGLELVLENLGDFRKGMAEANSLVGAFSKSGKEVEKAFSPVNKLLDTFTESLRRIGEFVIAGLIVRGFEKITSAIRDMVGAMVTAGMEFQTLQVRLEGLLAREILDSGSVKDFTEALQLAGPEAEDLFFWIQQLALKSPFDIQDVAETITFAKAYGFASDQAKILTGSIIDFSSGMGLTSVQMKRIIENFGQMIQQGKVTNTELRDLGRGALVPINDILERMRENLGLTTEEFGDLRKEGGLAVNDFIESFIQVVGEDFPNAAQRASRTVSAVLGNIKDLIDGILGFNVVKPILDVIGDKMAGILDALTTGERGEMLLAVTSEIGRALAGLAEELFGTLPEGDTIADLIIDKLILLLQRIHDIQDILGTDRSPQNKFLSVLQLFGLPDDFLIGLDQFMTKLRFLRDDVREIIEGFREGGLIGGLEAAGASPAIIGFVEDIQEALENIQVFWAQNKEQILRIIDDLLGSLLETGSVGGETLLEVLGNQLVRFSEILMLDGRDVLDWLEDFARIIREDVMPHVRTFGDWISNNQDNIVNFLLAMRILKEIAPAALALGAALAILNPPLSIFLGTLFILKNLDAFGTLWNLLVQLWEIIRLTTGILATGFSDTFSRVVEVIRSWGRNIAAEMWSVAYNAVLAFSDSFGRMWNWFLSNIRIMFQNMVNWIRWILGISSPSKVFEDLGKQSIEGYAKGIMEGFKLPEEAMKMAIQHTLAPAVNAIMPSGAGSSASTTNNFTLNVNSSARREPLIADFRQLESLASVR